MRSQYHIKKYSNEFSINGDQATMLVKDGSYVVCSVLLDAADVEKVSQYPWTLRSNGYVGAQRYDDTKMVYMHRFLCNPEDGQVVDHINRIRLDNRRANLRCVSQSVNGHNKESGNIRQLKHGNYNVYFKIGGKQRSFGTFATMQEAIGRRETVKAQLVAGRLDEKPKLKSSTGQRYVKKDRAGYMVVIPDKDARRYVGSFRSINEAVKARDEALWIHSQTG